MSHPPIINVQSVALESHVTGPPGYRARAKRVGPLLEAERLAATIYELEPGESVCPYHYEVGDEEWLLVLSGNPTVRHPDGEEVVEPGDLVCFPQGPDGAHKLSNQSQTAVRFVIFSTRGDPSICFYPDSGKIGVWPPGKFFKETDAVEYFHGEV